MRETLSLLRWHTWRDNMFSGWYLRLIKMWGWKCIFTDTWSDAKGMVRRLKERCLGVHP